MRTLRGEKQMLDRFFENDAPMIDLEDSIIEVGAWSSRILYPETP
jgi:hypothetical protein